MVQRRGFSVVECLVALAVLAIGLIGAGGTAVVAHRLASHARLRYAMASDALDEIDRFTSGACLPRDSTWRHTSESGWQGQWQVEVGDSVLTLVGRLEGFGSTPAGPYLVVIRRACS